MKVLNNMYVYVVSFERRQTSTDSATFQDIHIQI